MSLIVINLTLAKYSFLSVLPNSVGKLCCLSYCMYIFQNSSKTILKQSMEQRVYQIHCSNKGAVILKCSPCFKRSKCPGHSFKLTNLHINNLPFQN